MPDWQLPIGDRETLACRTLAAMGARVGAMTRKVLPEDRIHPAIREKITTNHRDIVDEVEAAVAAHDIVVVGMKQNPYPKRARKALVAKGIPFHYLEYGSYFNTWRRRTALKMWTGWPTLPMVFVKGVLIGGAEDLAKLLETGELEKLAAAA
jgi:glutaredoxin-related protein